MNFSSSKLLMIVGVVGLILVIGIFRETARALAARAFGASAGPLGGAVSLNPLTRLSFFGGLVVPFVAMYLIGWPIGGPSRAAFDENSVGPLKAAIVAVASLVGIAVAGFLIAFACAYGLARGWIDDVDRLRAPAYWILMRGVWWAAYDLLIELLPIPPAAGSRVVGMFLPASVRRIYYKIEPVGGILIILVVLWAVGFLGRQIPSLGLGFAREFHDGREWLFDQVDAFAVWLGA